MDHSVDRDLQLKDIAEVGSERFFISTIKMEVRHSWLNQHHNVNVYETMIFEKKGDEVLYDCPLYNRRYTTYENAKEGHEHILKHINKIVATCRECRTKLE